MSSIAPPWQPPIEGPLIGRAEYLSELCYDLLATAAPKHKSWSCQHLKLLSHVITRQNIPLGPYCHQSWNTFSCHIIATGRTFCAQTCSVCRSLPDARLLAQGLAQGKTRRSILPSLTLLRNHGSFQERFTFLALIVGAICSIIGVSFTSCICPWWETARQK